uniref:Uncharacterized protein n=1 Tax=Arundo donax TaxID=35708 RepID=A0A0A9G9C0_ARUDO
MEYRHELSRVSKLIILTRLHTNYTHSNICKRPKPMK